MGKYNPARMLPGPLIHAGIEADFRNLPIPKQMLLKSREGPRSHVGGFVFGSPAQSAGSLVGLPPGAEGNIMVTGTPEEVCRMPLTHTTRFLKEELQHTSNGK